MSNKQKDNGNSHAGDLSKGKTNVGFEKKRENPDESQKKQQAPNEEVPNVGDHEKKGPTIKPNPNDLKENADLDKDKEESLGEIVSQGKTEREEEQPEKQEAK